MSATALSQVLVALAAVILVGRLFAVLLKRLGQPPVIGEVMAGIALGPSLFIWFGYDASPLLPREVAPYLAIIAQLGVILYMFLVGVEFNADAFRKVARTAALVSLASLAVPFAAGVALGLGLQRQFAPAGV